MRPEPHANGGERAWEGYARTLQALLSGEEFVSVSVGEATGWNEFGTPRHDLPYWFLVLRVTPAAAWPAVKARLEQLDLGPCYGEGEDEVEYDNPAAGLEMVADVLAGLSQAQVRRALAKAEARSRDDA
jgi:hypothetical protein